MKIFGGLIVLAGAVLCAYGWWSYQFDIVSVSDAASAVQISQLANHAAVNILGGIGIMVVGLTAAITAWLEDIAIKLGDLSTQLTGRTYDS